MYTFYMVFINKGHHFSVEKRDNLEHQFSKNSSRTPENPGNIFWEVHKNNVILIF